MIWCWARGEERRSWRVIAGLGVSLGLALGTRIIAFAFIGQMGAVLAVLALALFATSRPRDAITKLWRAARPFALAMPLALFVMAIVWPWSVQAPFNIIAAFTGSANQFWHPDMLWAGEIINAGDLPPSYLLVLLGLQLSEYVLLGVVLVAVHAVAHARSWRLSTFAGARTLQYLYVAFTVIVPLAAFALLRPSTYNGVRHFLFVVPQLVVLAAIGLDHALAFLEQRRRVFAVGFAALLVLGAIHQIVVMARVHPYQYLSFNSLTGGVGGAYGRFELDYWGVSYKEATRGLAQFLESERAAGRPVPETARLFVCGANTSAGYYLPPGVVITDDRTQAEFFMGGDLTNPRCRTKPEGSVIVEVKRMGALLSYVLDLRGARP